MNRIALITLAFLAPSTVLALKAIEDGRAWNRASDSARNKLVREVVQLNKGNYPDTKMRSCIDTYYAPSAPAVQMEQDIVSTAIRCDATLKREK